MSHSSENSDDFTSFVFLKRLLDRNLDKKEEKDLTSLDRIVLEIKSLLGSRIQRFNKFQTVRYSPEENVTKYLMNFKPKNVGVLNKTRKDLKRMSFKSSYKRKH